MKICLGILFNIQQRIEDGMFQLLINSVRELKSLHNNTIYPDVLRSQQNVEILPSGSSLSGFELTVAGINFPRQLILKKFIDSNALRSIYDYIIIDGPPTLGLLVVNILSKRYNLNLVLDLIGNMFREKNHNYIKRSSAKCKGRCTYVFIYLFNLYIICI